MAEHHHFHKCKHEGKAYDNPDNVKRAQQFAEDVKSWVNLTKETVLLDFGSGTGHVGITLANDVKNIIFEDVSEEMLKQVNANCAEKNITNYTTFLGTMEEYKGEKVDLITAGMVLHHVDDLNSLFKSFLNNMKPHAHLCIVDFCTDAAFFSRLPVPLPHLGFVPEELGNQLISLGFVKYEVKPAVPYSHVQEDGSNELYNRFSLIAEAP